MGVSRELQNPLTDEREEKTPAVATIERLHEAVRHAATTELYRSAFGQMPEFEGFLEWFGQCRPTHRTDLIETQQRTPGLPAERIARICCTGGTTGSPVFLPRTAEEIRQAESAIVELYRLARVPPGAALALVLPFGLWNVAHLSMRAAEDLGLTVLPIGTMPSSEAVAELITRFRPQVLFSHPAQIRGLAACLQKAGTDPREVGLTSLLMAGEPFSEAERNEAESVWGATAISVYGCEELDALGVEQPGSTELTGFWDNIHYEIVSLDEDLRPLGEGEPGRLLLTSLNRRALPLVRYELGDVAEWADLDAGTFRLRGRIDEFLLLPGATKLYPWEAEATIRSSGIQSGSWQLAMRQSEEQLQLEFRFVDLGIGVEEAQERLLEELGRTIDLGDEVASGYLTVGVAVVEDADLTRTAKGKLLRFVSENEKESLT